MADGKLVLALGFFDGVHVAHGELLKETKREAERLGAAPAVLMFGSRPLDRVSGAKTELLSTDFDKKDIIMRLYGIDTVISMDFTEELMKTSWEDFTESLIKEYGVVSFVAGYDFRFGYKGEGNTEKLKEKCRSMGLGCRVI